MIKWAKTFGHNIEMEQLENMWLKGLKFTLSSSLKQNFYKMMYCWYLSPDKLSRMYKDISNLCWKYDQHEGTFYHVGWMCNKAKFF